ncbi:MAG: sulfite exporter TauE/SafE family protein [Candidatus Daviesbacteria bacterium]|nr:sulfite exporter TauE/SafE family protein [Candidatus Daviesbacteria bacterium]
MDLWLIFLTGLTVGGVSCMAVQGGLLASTIAAREEEDIRAGINHKHSAWPTLAFLATKFIAYLILGFILGSFGSALALSDGARIVMQIAAALYMILVALNLLNVHPIFRYVIIQPPRFLAKMVRNQSKSKDLFAPAFLGAMTVFIPCGTTLAMEALAISSGSPFLGAAIMGVFVLGTAPLFFGLGFLTTILGDAFRTKFLKIAGVAVLYLGITSLNGALVVAGSPITLQAIADKSPIQIDLSGGDGGEQTGTQVSGGVQEVDVRVLPGGYSPEYVQLQVGVPVRMTLTAGSRLGCASQFRIPSLGISKNLKPNEVATIEFTPEKKGKIIGTCSMGMYYMIMEVV